MLKEKFACVSLVIVGLLVAVVSPAGAAQLADPPDAGGFYGECNIGFNLNGTDFLRWSEGRAPTFDLKCQGPYDWDVAQGGDGIPHNITFKFNLNAPNQAKGPLTYTLGTNSGGFKDLPATYPGDRKMTKVTDPQGVFGGTYQLLGNATQYPGMTHPADVALDLSQFSVNVTYKRGTALNPTFSAYKFKVVSFMRIGNDDGTGVVTPSPVNHYAGGSPGGAPCRVTRFEGPVFKDTETYKTSDTPFLWGVGYMPWGYAQTSKLITMWPDGTEKVVENYPSAANAQSGTTQFLNQPIEKGGLGSQYSARLECTYTKADGSTSTVIIPYKGFGEGFDPMGEGESGSSKWSLTECLSGTGLELSPSSWVPGMLKGIACVLRWAFVPQVGVFDGVTEAWGTSGAQAVALPVGLLNAAWQSFDNGASGGTSCTGPSFTFSIPGTGTTYALSPLHACSGVGETAALWSTRISTVMMILAGMAAVMKITLGSFGFAAPANAGGEG